MLFSEVYGRYYQVVSSILSEAVRGELTEQKIRKIVEEKAFSESGLVIPQALKEGTWPLLTKNMETSLQHEPVMPMTLLEKRWMKTLLKDSRIQLFGVSETGLEDIEPLYPSDAVVYFDRYDDGDDFNDEGYIERFGIILQALREKRKLEITYQSQGKKASVWNCIPRSLEYSSKDDKFRLYVASKGIAALNLSRIVDVKLLEQYSAGEDVTLVLKKEKLVLEVKDERNALERVMLHFSHFEKETIRLEEKKYQLTLWYEKEDKAELLIRVLSFGPMIRVMEPDSFISLVSERLQKQMRFVE